ncbi:hypothetical protein BUALT_Bualt05G0024000 [Buddleja alternifolia]|uniref:Maturase K n=1 Tax=Buddleja alternifolia TaxID=168488 RepID=A0AAV6XMY7_9LAMI|nr:hypothetical protein BUALT_Bualt05G0024000 [Buddleja alternifolia]
MKQAFDWYSSVVLYQYACSRFSRLVEYKIRTLPSSLFALTNLQVLMLETAIVSLSISSYRFYGPDSVREYHNLSPQLISHDIISKLEELQGLSIVIHPQDRRWKEIAEEVTKDVATLKMLSYLEFYFPEVESFQCFIRTRPSWNEHILRKFRFIFGYDVKRIIHQSTRGRMSKRFTWNITLKPEACQNSGFVEVIVDEDKISEAAFPCLEYLLISYLPELKQICKLLVPCGSFHSLKYLTVNIC